MHSLEPALTTCLDQQLHAWVKTPATESAPREPRELPRQVFRSAIPLSQTSRSEPVLNGDSHLEGSHAPLVAADDLAVDQAGPDLEVVHGLHDQGGSGVVPSFPCG